MSIWWRGIVQRLSIWEAKAVQKLVKEEQDGKKSCFHGLEDVWRWWTIDKFFVQQQTTYSFRKIKIKAKNNFKTKTSEAYTIDSKSHSLTLLALLPTTCEYSQKKVNESTFDQHSHEIIMQEEHP